MFFLYLLSQKRDKSVNMSELIRFQNDVLSGKLYDKLATECGIDRDDVKPKFFRYLFGGAHAKFKAFNIFYPTTTRFIRKYKIELGDYKLLSHELQLLEGDFIFNGICKELSIEKIKFFTVHDSICVKSSDYDRLDSIFETNLNNLNKEIIDKIKNYYS